MTSCFSASPLELGVPSRDGAVSRQEALVGIGGQVAVLPFGRVLLRMEEFLISSYTLHRLPGCYPFYKTDPFIFTDCPHVYFCGNAPRFRSKELKGEGPTGLLTGPWACPWSGLLRVPRHDSAGRERRPQQPVPQCPRRSWGPAALVLRWLPCVSLLDGCAPVHAGKTQPAVPACLSRVRTQAVHAGGGWAGHAAHSRRARSRAAALVTSSVNRSWR